MTNPRPATSLVLSDMLFMQPQQHWLTLLLLQLRPILLQFLPQKKIDTILKRHHMALRSQADVSIRESSITLSWNVKEDLEKAVGDEEKIIIHPLQLP